MHYPTVALLRLLVDAGTVMEARSVRYRPQPPELFRVPTNYAPALGHDSVPRAAPAIVAAMSHMPPIDDRRRRALLTREGRRLIVPLYF